MANTPPETFIPQELRDEIVQRFIEEFGDESLPELEAYLNDIESQLSEPIDPAEINVPQAVFTAAQNVLGPDARAVLNFRDASEAERRRRDRQINPPDDEEPPPDVADAGTVSQVGRQFDILEAGARVDAADPEDQAEIRQEEADSLGMAVEQFAQALAAIRASTADPSMVSRYGLIPSEDDYEDIARRYEARTGVELDVEMINLFVAAEDDLMIDVADQVFAGRTTEFQHIRLSDGTDVQVRQSVFNSAASIEGIEREQVSQAIRWAHELGIPDSWGYIAVLGMVPTYDDVEGSRAAVNWLAAEGRINTISDLTPDLMAEGALATPVAKGEPVFGRLAALRQDLDLADIRFGRGPGDPLTDERPRGGGGPERRGGQVQRSRQAFIDQRLEYLTETEDRVEELAKGFAAALPRYGGNHSVALIHMTMGPSIAQHVWDNDGPTSEAMAREIRAMMGDLSDAELRALQIDVESQDWAMVTTAPPPGQTVFYEPADADSLREAHTQLFQSWFGGTPTETELSGFVAEINGALRSNAQARLDANKPRLSGKQAPVQGDRIVALPTPDPAAASRERARNDPRYQEYFGRKGVGQTEEEYIGQFQRAAADLFGARSVDNVDARLAGQRTGDTDTTIGQLLFSGDVVESETFVDRAARLVKMIERMS